MIQEKDHNRISFPIGVSWKPWQERKEVFTYSYCMITGTALCYQEKVFPLILAAQGIDEAALTIRRFEKQPMF